jgi:hypothetical protein
MKTIGLVVWLLIHSTTDWQGSYRDTQNSMGQTHTLHLYQTDFEYVSAYDGEGGRTKHILTGNYQVKQDTIFLYGVRMEEITDDMAANIHQVKKKVYHKTIALKIIDKQTLGLGNILLKKYN